MLVLNNVKIKNNLNITKINGIVSNYNMINVNNLKLNTFSSIHIFNKNFASTSTKTSKKSETKKKK